MPEVFTVTVGHENADMTGGTNAVIQEAIERAAAAGPGVVKILPGKYVMNDSLHLRSGVTVEGSGEETVLWMPDGVASALSLYAGYGHYDVSVAEPEKFHVGMGIMISDDSSGGFYNTVASVVGKYGDTLVIDRMLNHDYTVWQHASAVSSYPIISGIGVEKACVRNLAINGNASGNSYIDGCRSGGVFLLQCRDTTLSGLRVADYNGDGISFQQCVDILIEDCACENCQGHGLHPGSGSVGAVIRGFSGVNNGADGLFFCLRATRLLVENSAFCGNKGQGISVGHRDTDIEIRNCRIEDNGLYGVFFRNGSPALNGSRTLIAGCLIKGNLAQKGEVGIFFRSKAEDVYIFDNTGGGADASEADYLSGVTFGPPPEGYSFSAAYKDERELDHLGPWRRNS
ncbi:MAG: right-handed parallel beta-helix repeat-containing protein [Defluviitaleaceae bacterium]|nr:right-handed parallel beta-helix repeat-containing protein [Defluviitaleaceae bacterium]